MLNKFAKALNTILGLVTNEHFLVRKDRNGAYVLIVNRHLFGFCVYEETYKMKDLLNESWI